jgi:hypothetical protein
MKRPALWALGLAMLGTSAMAGQFNAIVDIGAPMPTFENLPATDGSSVSSSAITEDVVVLVSLANHCPWVQGMDRDLVSLASDLEGKSARVVAFAVNRRDDDRLPAMKEHAKRAGYDFTYVYDESQALGRALGATRTPEYFVFDKNRKLVYMGLIHNSPARMTSSGPKHVNGEPTRFYVKDAVDATLRGAAADPAETRAQGCTVEYES